MVLLTMLEAWVAKIVRPSLSERGWSEASITNHKYSIAEKQLSVFPETAEQRIVG